METKTRLRPLHEIGDDISRAYKSDSMLRYAADPYIKAIRQLTNCGEMYGAEYGDMIVAYLLNNLTQFRGERARELKKELKAHLDAYNSDHEYWRHQWREENPDA